MDIPQLDVAHKLLQEYVKVVGQKKSPKNMGFAVVAYAYEKESNEKSDMWRDIGMGITRKDLQIAADFLTEFGLLTDEGPSTENYSKYDDFHDYKITKLGIIVANNDGGLENLTFSDGKIDFTKLIEMTSSNKNETSNNITNNFVNSPVGQFQQAQGTTNTNQSINSEDEVSAKNTNKINTESTQKKKSIKDVLIKWWWAFIIPIIVGVILIYFTNILGN